jgi:hypothetical protein
MLTEYYIIQGDWEFIFSQPNLVTPAWFDQPGLASPHSINIAPHLQRASFSSR